MSFGGFVRRIGYSVKDWISNSLGDRIVPQWKEIRETLSDYKFGWPKVEASLARCLAWARENSPFYADKGPDLASFPVMTKLDFINNAERIKCPCYAREKLHVSSTSGSTGTPFKVWQNKAKRNRVLAELQHFGERGGYPSHEKMVFLRACHPVARWNMFWSNVWQLDIASLSKGRMEALYRELEHGCVGLLAYASTYDVLTQYWLSKGYRGSESVRVALSGSEILREDVRERVETFWPNCRCLSRYSNMENGIFGQEYDKKGVFELNWASYYFEVLKFDSDETAKPGELGRIIVTDMYNRAFPMIRYDKGDVGMLSLSEDSWPCLVQLGGRRLDLIHGTDGHICSPHLLSTGLWGVEHVVQWQFIQEGRKNYRITFIATNAELARASLESRIPKLKTFLGVDAEIELEQVDAFPQLASRKHKMCVQNAPSYQIL